MSRFFYDFVFAYAIYNLFFSNNGLSVLQISLLLAWWALNAMVFEVPTGALADKWSRKQMLVIAPLIKSLCFVIWFFAGANFFLYALGFSLWALASAFVSGTAEALLYDNLVSIRQQNDYEKFLGKKKLYFYLALAFSSVSGGLIAQYRLDWAILFSAIPLLLSAFFALFIKEATKAQSTDEIKYFEHIKLALREVKTNKILFIFIAYLVGISIFGGVEEYDQLYYKLVGLPIFAFGLVGFCWSFFQAIGSYLAFRIKGKDYLFYLIPFLGAVLLLIVGAFPSIPIIALLLLSYFLYSPIRVLIESKIQHSIKAQSRATITSLSTFLIELSGVILAPIFGFIGRALGLTAIYIGFGIFLLLFSFWALGIKKHFSS